MLPRGAAKVLHIEELIVAHTLYDGVSEGEGVQRLTDQFTHCYVARPLRIRERMPAPRLVDCAGEREMKRLAILAPVAKCGRQAGYHLRCELTLSEQAAFGISQISVFEEGDEVLPRFSTLGGQAIYCDRPLGGGNQHDDRRPKIGRVISGWQCVCVRRDATAPRAAEFDVSFDRIRGDDFGNEQDRSLVLRSAPTAERRTRQRIDLLLLASAQTAR
ncbi:hypothetical protein PP1Y_Lpl1312 (plasmid) [Novosphingobium sp. PP1Y]|nr:hypothetical protein PP1Y_Lpl1312 [Novosphingobium sp. PP1Y]